MIWKDLFLVFFKLGALTWGGGYAMLPGMQRDCVEVHQWVDAKTFSDFLVIAQSAPGPVATSMAVLIGRHLAGAVGSILCLIAVSLPSFVITLLIAMFLLAGPLPAWSRDMLYILKPAVTGLILACGWRLALGLEHQAACYIIGAASLVLMLVTGLHPALALLLGGTVLALLKRGKGVRQDVD